MQTEIKELKECGNAIPDLVKISFPLNDYKKYFMEEDELCMDNKIYAVISEDIKNDSIVFYCVQDIQEQELFAFFDALFEAEETNTGSGETQLLNFLFLSTVLHRHNSLNKNSVHLASIQDITPVLQSQYLTPITLPPEKILFV